MDEMTQGLCVENRGKVKTVETIMVYRSLVEVAEKGRLVRTKMKAENREHRKNTVEEKCSVSVETGR